MRPYRKLLLPALLLAMVLSSAAVVVYLNLASPPSAAFLLPEGNLLLYVNLRPAHFLERSGGAAVQLEPEYQAFVQQTGFQFERDLREVAFSQRDSGNGADTESSEIFTGHFDEARVREYLQKIAAGREDYADRTIFSLPHQGHIVRACILNADTVAVTNMQSPEPMRGIIERFRRQSLLSRWSLHSPYLVERYYRYVPLTSLAWMIDRMPSQPGKAQLPGGLNFSFLEGKVAVASLRYHGPLLLKAEVFSGSDAEARQLTDTATAFLALYRSATLAAGAKGFDQDVKAAFESIQVQQNGSRSVFTATIPPGFVRKALAETQAVSR